ncbi:MAG: hypothetical protein BroJett026_34730 [Betaproteobacteria bacterium]|nr:MAG: hypothetical protein BroJett026_34730 [Betaproteobacteria bacterium]
MPARYLIVVVFALLGVSGCATTPYRDIEVTKLTDEQLAEEFTAAARSVGHSIEKAQLLIATRPDPLYVLSSSTTTYFGTSNVAYSGYAIPTRYGGYYTGSAQGTHSGISQSRHYYTDVNALARIVHVVGAATAQVSAEAARRRGQDVAAEMQRRVEARRAQATLPVDKFFAEHKELENAKPLVTAVLAFTPSQGASDGSESLRKAKQVIDSMQRGPDLAGDWYGVFAQISALPDGRKFAMNNFLRLRIAQHGTKLTGSGELGTGEEISIDCEVIDDEVTGTVTNISSPLNLSVRVNGRKDKRDNLRLEFSGGSRLVNVSINGNVGLYR